MYAEIAFNSFTVQDGERVNTTLACVCVQQQHALSVPLADKHLESCALLLCVCVSVRLPALNERLI